MRELKEIEGFLTENRGKNEVPPPEYVYAVTKAYSDVVKGVAFSPETEEGLAEIFGRICIY